MSGQYSKFKIKMNYDLDSCLGLCLCSLPLFVPGSTYWAFVLSYTFWIIRLTHIYIYSLIYFTDVWNVSLEDAEEQAARDILAELLASELRQVSCIMILIIRLLLTD